MMYNEKNIIDKKSSKFIIYIKKNKRGRKIMISENKLQEICDKYQINFEKLVKNNPNILSNGEENNIKYVLEFLKNELKISANNIEKCPSILYKAVDNIELNWQFLKKENITVSNIESCLHILSSEPVELKRTYEYIKKIMG